MWPIIHDYLIIQQHDRPHQRKLAIARKSADHAYWWRKEDAFVWNDIEADEKIKVYDKGRTVQKTVKLFISNS